MRTITAAVALGASVLALACGGTPRVEATITADVGVARTETPVTTACVEQWVHMPVHIGFPTGGTVIDQQNRLVLGEMVRTAQNRPDIRRVRVEGHTDSCGNEHNNLALSQNRAISVASELVTMGVAREMIETVGHGSSMPLGEESCQHNQQRTREVNRRVEFSLLVCR